MPWRLVFKHLGAHTIRSFLTLGSLVVAIFLICFLRSIILSMASVITDSANNRLMAQSAVSLFVDLPLSYQSKIEQVPGVKGVCKMQWFGGVYKERSNFFPQFAIDHDRFLEAYPEIELVQGDPEAFRRSRTACLVGDQLAERFGWRLGTRVPILGTIFPRVDGRPYEFEVAGIYHSRSSNVDNSTLWFHFAYLEEALESGATIGPRGVGFYVLGLERGADLVQVAAKVDRLFENGPQRVQTTTEAEFQRQFLTMLGSVPTFLSSIGGGVLFAIVLAVFNTMLMAGRERTQTLGVLKALGFSDGVACALLLSESLFLCGLGGLLGVGLALGSQEMIQTFLGSLLPMYQVTPSTALEGISLALGIGLAAGIVPAWRASRLRCVDALRAEL